MIRDFVQTIDFRERRIWVWAVVGLTLLSAFYLGRRASNRWLMLFALGTGTLAMVREPRLGLLGLISAVMIVPLEFSTGTEVRLNVATLLIPALFGLWVVEGIRRHEFHWRAARVNRPLVLFLLASLLSFLVGNVLWDPAVPKTGNFWLVQLAQWAIFAFAALAFWLTANLRDVKTWLPRLTWTFLYLGGGLAILYLLPTIGTLVSEIMTVVIIRAPFWVLLTALAGGQLLFEPNLSRGQRYFLCGVLAAVFYYAFVAQREGVSNWVGVSAVMGVLLWLRFPKIRGVVVALAVILALSGVLFSGLYQFAGGDAEWSESGASRLLLIRHVLRVASRNPLTGLGPASYRAYANSAPFFFNNRVWVGAVISSHNNYVDLFAHSGLLGLGFFLWFAVELGLLGWRLSRRYQTGFIGGYVNGMTAAWIASLVSMLLADWMLPFVYNIGFPGFQASILVWMFLGGLVSFEDDMLEEAGETHGKPT